MIAGLVYSTGGLVLLAFAADHFVRGAARLAVVLRIAPVVVGAIVVGFGTSAPEMVVSALAAAEGQLDIGVGNILGSNVANITLVLGAAAMVSGITVARPVIRRDAPASLASVIVLALLVQNGLTRTEGVLLLALLLAWLALVIRGASDEAEPADSSQRPPQHEASVGEIVGDKPPKAGPEALRTLLGLVFVIVAAYVLVDGAERIAEALDLSGGFVGYTMVAVGTSAPELVTAVIAARQGHTDLLVGNLLGSNVFNSLAVGGLIAVIGPGQLQDVALQTLGSSMMVAICALSWITMTTGRRVTRLEAIGLLVVWTVSVALLGS